MIKRHFFQHIILFTLLLLSSYGAFAQGCGPARCLRPVAVQDHTPDRCYECPVEGGRVKVYKEIHPFVCRIPKAGLDIVCPKNTQVRSMSAGKVTAVISMPDQALAILIKTGGRIFVYANLESTAVQKGDDVEIGDLLGIPALDSSNERVLHMQLWKGTTEIDLHLACLQEG